MLKLCTVRIFMSLTFRLLVLLSECSSFVRHQYVLMTWCLDTRITLSLFPGVLFHLSAWFIAVTCNCFYEAMAHNVVTVIFCGRGK